MATQFLTKVLSYLNPDVSYQCQSLYSSLFTINASSVIGNIGKFSVLLQLSGKVFEAVFDSVIAFKTIISL
jgi:hypothetical protein